MTNDELTVAKILSDYDQKLSDEIAAWDALPPPMKDAMVIAVSHMQSRGKTVDAGPEFLIRMVQLGMATLLTKQLEREMQPCPTE